MFRRMYVLIAVLTVVLAACNANEPSSIGFDAIPAEGDPAQGAILYEQAINGTPACTACHIEGASAAPYITAGYADLAATRVEGESAREYSFWAIAEPGRHIVEGYGNAMYNQYDENLTPEQIADLIAYMLSL